MTKRQEWERKHLKKRNRQKRLWSKRNREKRNKQALASYHRLKKAATS